MIKIRILFLRPDFELATKFGAYWLKKLEEGLELSHDIRDLYKPNPSDADKEVELFNPDLIIGEGHGSYDLFTLQYKRVWLIAGDYNKNLVGKSIYLLSCRAGKELGKWLVENNGVKQFIGYTRDYVFLTNSNDPEDKYAIPFFDTFIYIVWNAINNGLEKAYIDGINRYKYWINLFTHINNPLSVMVASFLYNDMTALVVYPEVKEEKKNIIDPRVVAIPVGMALLLFGFLTSQ